MNEVLILLLLLTACGAPMPASLGISGGRLRACPDSPNCVSTHAPPEDPHYMQAIIIPEGVSDVMERIAEAVKAAPRSRVATRDGPYLHAEFRSRVFRFVDDVEFLFDEEARLLHFRSASRMGQGDFGVNRERMEGLTQETVARLR